MTLTKTHKITALILLFVTLLLIGWDIYVVLNDVKGDTISAMVWEYSQKWVTIPAGMGMLMGHLFWAREKWTGIIPSKYAVAILLATCIILDIIGIPMNSFAVPLVFAGAFVYGHFFWTNRGENGA